MVPTAANYAAERQGIVFDLSRAYLYTFIASAGRAGVELHADDAASLERLREATNYADPMLRPHPTELMNGVFEVTNLMDTPTRREIERHSLFPNGVEKRPVPEQALSAQRWCIDTVKCALAAEWESARKAARGA